jgi:tRNA A-37 threonylcarbamoyl transferase component Bud32
MKQHSQKIVWQTLSKDNWTAIKADCKIIEQDGFGVKVLGCQNGDYIKVFRIKHKISMGRLLNPAQRFCDNVRKLKALGIDTVTPVALYHIPHSPRWAVRYRPLAGETLRSLIAQFSMPENVIAELGEYIARLHDKGIYFRSLHPGNVVLQPNGKLGLIDVLDCKFSWFGRPLTAWQRERNFRHFFRYEDGKLIEAGVREAYEAARFS